MPDTIYRQAIFVTLEKQLCLLANRVALIKKRQPGRYAQHPHTKLLATVVKAIEDSARDPLSQLYQLGKTMGKEYTGWRRCKKGRYRLFFRVRSVEKICVYAWLNDENTLRKDGGKTDVYVVFRHLLDSGIIPSKFIELLQRSRYWDELEKKHPALKYFHLYCKNP